MKLPILFFSFFIFSSTFYAQNLDTIQIKMDSIVQLDAKSFSKTAKYFFDNRKETILSFLRHSNKVAMIYYHQGQLKKAEEYYLKVLVHPIELEPNKSLQKLMYKQYQIADEGLLFCRKDNLALLERTWFHKGFEGRLNIIKQKLIDAHPDN